MNKATAERNQRALNEINLQPGNDACADCKARNPRWASHNLGIFICMNCASIHRKLGTHITKVKSVTMDTWTREQVDVMRQTGNLKSNAAYNPNEEKHRPPTNMIDSERDSELEVFIRNKYEFKKFIPKPPKMRRPRSPVRLSPPPVSTSAPPIRPPVVRASAPLVPPVRTASLPPKAAEYVPPPPPVPPPQNIPPPANSVWNDLLSLQAPTQSSTLPLQYGSPNVEYQHTSTNPFHQTGWGAASPQYNASHYQQFNQQPMPMPAGFQQPPAFQAPVQMSPFPPYYQTTQPTGPFAQYNPQWNGHPY